MIFKNKLVLTASVLTLLAPSFSLATESDRNDSPPQASIPLSLSVQDQKHQEILNDDAKTLEEKEKREEDIRKLTQQNQLVRNPQQFRNPNQPSGNPAIRNPHKLPPSQQFHNPNQPRPYQGQVVRNPHQQPGYNYQHQNTQNNLRK